MQRNGITLAIAALGLLGVTACVDASGGTSTPESLDQLQITDPSFDFSTSRAVRLELRADEAAEAKAVEVTDSEGRRLMDGAFRGSAVIDLKVPVGRARTLKLRVGQGDEAVERDLDVDADRAVGEL